MPRIPSVSDVRSVSASATRDPGLRASAEDFGLGIARGIAGVGGGLNDLGDGIEVRRRRKQAAEERAQEREEQREQTQFLQRMFQQFGAALEKVEAVEAKMQSMKHVAEMRQTSEAIIEAEQYRGGSPLKAAEESKQELIRQEEQSLKALPTESRALAREAAALVRQGHGLRAAQRLQNQRVIALEQGTAATLTLLQEQAVADPAAAAKLTADGLELLRQLHGEGALSDAALEAQSAAFRRELYVDMLRGQAAVDVVADLEAGLYDEALGEPGLKQQVLTENRWRLQGELAQGQANARTLAESEARGETPIAALSEATQVLLAVGDFADLERDVDVERRVRSAIESLRFAPESSFDDEIDKLAPAAGAEDRPARLAIQEAVRRGSERLLEERRADPADYMMGLPSIAQAFAAAKDAPSLLPAAVRGRLAAQEAMGLKPEEQRALTKGEVTEILQGFQTVPLEARVEAAKALRTAYGDQIGGVAAELEEAGLPFRLVQALDPSGDTISIQDATGLPEALASGSEGDIIQEAADRLLAGSMPPLPRLKPLGPNGSQGASITPFAGEDAVPPIPPRRPGRQLTSSEQALLEKYRPLMEKDETEVREGLDARLVAGLEAMIDHQIQGGEAHPAINELAKRLALKHLGNGEWLERAVSLALIEMAIEEPNPSLDTSRYMPKPTGDPVVDAQAIMDRVGLFQQKAPEGAIAAVVLERLRDLPRMREIERRDGRQGLERFFSRMLALNRSGKLPFNHDRVAFHMIMLAGEVRETPYKYPWSLSNAELLTAMSFLAARGKEMADEALLMAVPSVVVGLIPGGTAVNVVKITLQAIGISDAISAKAAASALNNIVLEAMHRRLLPTDRRLLPQIGLEED